ncbi:pyrroline-5-carboxylate reductase [Demequina capsici]|uniref:Pyrroline-5-carboxylate reductase n=1 Tax=Demequina capsici TaxID=3075620 RepID=A0AA96F9X3_9MICO|nr:pyrroline-5-carboxylate reductase [Demequina sp. OYTSA14]WNM24305.1 pyrroline-5-carboxylate reductase [Demequina sp. OYTSA14]
MSETTFPRVAVLGGGGTIGTTVIGAMRGAGWPAEQIVAAGRSEERLAPVAAEFGVETTTSAADAVVGADVVVTSVKPQDMRALLAQIADAVSPDALVLTVAAALPSSFYEDLLTDGTAVVRSMPNTPARLGKGATSISAGAYATEEHLALAERILAGTGLVVRVDEEQIPGVSVVSGSGPAFFYAVAEAMAAAGMANGLDRELAEALAAQTLIGAGALLEQSGESPAELRAKVSSKGGTTLAALAAMGAAGLQDVISAGANAAVARSKELGEELQKG